jgi:hypothetical protein
MVFDHLVLPLAVSHGNTLIKGKEALKTLFGNMHRNGTTQDLEGGMYEK